VSEESGREKPLEALSQRRQTQYSQEDLEAVYRQYHDLVYRAAYRVTGNPSDAEDVLQTVFLRLARREVDADIVGQPAGYLRRAAVNAALDLLRSRQRSRSVPLEDLEPVLPEASFRAPDREFAAGELREWLRKTVARLSPMAAEVFALRFFEGKDNPEIAELLGTSVGAVSVTLSRARDRVEREFRAYVGGRP
jgi:RNA polymerase sigma-70 factor (ECF subfamily)